MTGRLTLRNRVAGQRLNLRLLRQIVQRLLSDFPACADWDLGIYLVGEPEMIRLNETFVRHRGSTDVITFDYPDAIESEPRACELFVCLDEARVQACRFGTTWQSEIVRYIVHGLLHLNGYDDRRGRDRARMKQRENQLVRGLSGEFRLERLGRVVVRSKGKQRL